MELQELAHLAEREASERSHRAAYLGAHPELRGLLSDLTTALLVEKPSNIFPFAADHFSTLGTPPALRGPPALVVASDVDTSSLGNLGLEAFAVPTLTTTRPPRKSDPLTLDHVRDVADELFFEVGDDDVPGARIGTSLQAIAAVRSRGKIPLLHLPRARALSASGTDCKLVHFALESTSSSDRFDKTYVLPGAGHLDFIRTSLLGDLLELGYDENLR